MTATEPSALRPLSSTELHTSPTATSQATTTLPAFISTLAPTSTTTQCSISRKKFTPSFSPKMAPLSVAVPRWSVSPVKKSNCRSSILTWRIPKTTAVSDLKQKSPMALHYLTPPTDALTTTRNAGICSYIIAVILPVEMTSTAIQPRPILPTKNMKNAATA